MVPMLADSSRSCLGVHLLVRCGCLVVLYMHSRARVSRRGSTLSFTHERGRNRSTPIPLSSPILTPFVARALRDVCIGGARGSAQGVVLGGGAHTQKKIKIPNLAECSTSAIQWVESQD